MWAGVIAAIAMQGFAFIGEAAWDAKARPALNVELRPQAAPASMGGWVDFDVELRAPDGRIAVSPFLTTTRGMLFEVLDRDGKRVSPLEAMPGSPPAPPLMDDKLASFGGGTPYVAKAREKARWLFPGPGAYRMRAVVVLANFKDGYIVQPAGTGQNRIEAESPWVSVVVTD